MTQGDPRLPARGAGGRGYEACASLAHTILMSHLTTRHDSLGRP